MLVEGREDADGLSFPALNRTFPRKRLEELLGQPQSMQTSQLLKHIRLLGQLGGSYLEGVFTLTPELYSPEKGKVGAMPEEIKQSMVVKETNRGGAYEGGISIAALLIGAAAGFAAGMLLAPKSQTSRKNNIDYTFTLLKSFGPQKSAKEMITDLLAVYASRESKQ
jgi:hypothetical protein